MKKLTWRDFRDIIYKHNIDNNITQQYSDKNHLNCVIVFNNSSFTKNYSIKERSYRFRSDEKYFISSMLGNSIFADCLDGIDNGVRLDEYLDDWEIEYCYIEEALEEENESNNSIAQCSR